MLEPVGEPEVGEPVGDPVVDHLRLRALGRGDRVGIGADDPRRGRRVDVLARGEDLAQDVLARDVSEDPQLDLVVVAGEQQIALLGDEAGSHRAPDLGADRDVLKVRVRRREAPRGRASPG